MALAVATSPAPVQAGATVGTTASFTPTASSLLVAVGASGSSGTPITGAVTDSLGSTWTLIRRNNAARGEACEVWMMDAGASPAARTVTWTVSTGGDGAAFSVGVFTGAQTTAQHSATVGSSASGTQLTISLTPAASGSLIVGSAGYAVANQTWTVNAATSVASPWTMFNNAGDTETHATFIGTSATTASTSQTLGFTNTAVACNMVAVEVLAAATSSATEGGRLYQPSSLVSAAGPYGLGRPQFSVPRFSSGPDTGTPTNQPFIGWGWGVSV